MDEGMITLKLTPFEILFATIFLFFAFACPTAAAFALLFNPDIAEVIENRNKPMDVIYGILASGAVCMLGYAGMMIGMMIRTSRQINRDVLSKDDDKK